jgi:hypothetical protein
MSADANHEMNAIKLMVAIDVAVHLDPGAGSSP